MDKSQNKVSQTLKYSVFTRGVLISCIGLGLTACSETRPGLYGAYGNSWQNSPSSQGAFYVPHAQVQRQTPYVLLAQNNSVPGLRGSSEIRQRILQQYHFDDHPKTHTVLDSSSLPSNGTSAYEAPRNTVSDPRQFFKHQLEEAAPRTLGQVQVSPQTSRSAPVSAPVVTQQQNAVSTGQTGPTQNAAQQPSHSANFQPAFQGTGKSLTQSLDTALAQSPRLAIEDIRIQEAEEGLEQAKAQGRFKLNLDSSVGAGQNETEFRVVNRTDTDFRVSRTANLGLSLPLYEGGRISAQKDVAKVDINTAKANYDAVESEVAEQAGIAHLNVLRDRALVEVYQRNVALLQNQKNTVQALLGAGENTVTDQALVEARLASIQVRLQQARSTLSASESRYKKLTGHEAPALSAVEQVGLPATLQEVKDIAFSHNAELQARQSEAESAFHNIKVAKSIGRPKLALQGNLRAAEGLSETIRRNSAAEVLLNLSVPILSGGENKSRVREAALAQSRSALETRALQEDLNERLEQLWAAVSAAQQSRAPNLAQKAASEAAYEAILQQRKAGVATSLDVLSVEQTLLDSELNIIQAENSEAVARLQILGIMGAL